MARLWKPDEDAILSEYYPRHGIVWPGWADVLPNRSEMGIHSRAYALGLRYEGPRKCGYRIDMKTANERAAAAVAALSEWQQTRLALLVTVAGKEVEW